MGVPQWQPPCCKSRLNARGPARGSVKCKRRLNSSLACCSNLTPTGFQIASMHNDDVTGSGQLSPCIPFAIGCIEVCIYKYRSNHWHGPPQPTLRVRTLFGSA
ncbi:hypothetical protein SCLCIDRAFT_1222368 [Scleroderma citrinum Foug A]|uniref:Uncharacterized protein n=1 Tax=Scleroderma citrinum Foug A TaxID=1036808 RepID=A0A0C3CZH5_9AGAM|nr:hypothetical protein SCLCIDRAFT_1222368 [Scleroderma citrinum Foug A]